MPSSSPKLSSVASVTPKISSTASTSGTWVPNPSEWRKSGSSYFSRFDDLNDVDNTYTPPSDAGLSLIFGGTGFEVDSGSDVYVGTIVDSDKESIWIPLPACSLTNLYIASSVAPGSGQTFTMTVYKDTVAQSMQAVISGSGTSSSYSSSTITFSAGEKFSIRVQTSAGAATAFLTYSVRLE